MYKSGLPTLNCITFVNQQEQPIELVYAIANRQHTKWGINEMPTMRIYEDIGKVKKSKVKPTKRGSFWDDLTKYHSKIPGPKYQSESFWSEPETVNKKKPKQKQERMTIFDENERRLKRHPIPGVAKYTLDTKTERSFSQQNIKADMEKMSSRRHEFENNICISESPGPGAYNHSTPDKIIPYRFKQTISRTKPLKSPGPQNYSPENPSYFTFSKKPAASMGVMKVHKSAVKKDLSNPGPVLGQNSISKGWMDKVSNGPTYSMYYDD